MENKSTYTYIHIQLVANLTAVLVNRLYGTWENAQTLTHKNICAI